MLSKSITSVFLFWLVRVTAAIVPEGLPSPNGYLVFTYYKYAQCEGAKQERMAAAIETCIDSSTSLRGEPYASSYYMYRLNGDFVDAWLYSDPNCKQNGQIYEQIELGACSNTGDAAFATYSESLPELSLSEAAVQHVVYNESESCDWQNSLILTYAVYTSGCRINCNYENVWYACEFPMCFNGTVNTTYSVDNKCSENFAYSLTSSGCAESVTCFDNGNASNNEDDDSVAGWAIALIVIFSLLFVGGVVAGVYYFVFRPSSSNEKGLSDSLM